MVSAFASALGTATADSRMLFILCRDGFLSRRLDTSAQTLPTVSAVPRKTATNAHSPKFLRPSTGARRCR
jgi:hypothetical protein